MLLDDDNRLTIRPVTTEDLDEVVTIERACHSHPWTADLFLKELSNPVSSIDLCIIDGEITGYLCSWFFCGELEIQNIATSPSFRRRGVASALLKHLVERVKADGVERAFLEVRRSNSGAIALYRAFGFEHVGCRERYYPDGEDALLMEWHHPS